MRAYRFRLATVARVRVLEERVAKDRFMTALRGVRLAEEAERDATSALRGLEAPQGSVTVADVVWLGDQAERCAESLRACRQVVAAARSRCAEARRAWNDAAKRASVLERLDDEGRAQWRQDALRHEVAELDDLTQVRYGRVGADR
jgi:flagellar export protein FliJ